MHRLRAAGVGTAEKAVRDARAQGLEVAVMALSSKVPDFDDAEKAVMLDRAGFPYEIVSARERVHTTEDGQPATRKKTVVHGPGAPGAEEFLGVFEGKEGVEGCAERIAQRLLNEHALAVILVDGTSKGDALARITGRAVAWHVWLRNKPLGKALKRGVPLPREPWAKEVIKLLDATKTRTGLLERMRNYYHSKIAHVI